MKLGVDVDGVLADLVGHFTTYYRHAFDDPSYEHSGTWDLHEGTVFDDTRAVFKHLDQVPGFYTSMPTLPGVQGGVWQLLSAGHELRLITNRTQVRETVAWVAKWWPVDQLPRIDHVPGDKGVVDCQIYVEDSPVRLVELLRHRPVVVRMRHPWNDTHFKDSDDLNLFHVETFMEFVGFVNQVQAEGLESVVHEDLVLQPRPQGEITDGAGFVPGYM